jgi:predicted nucleotidyltransferase component of viral defense system
MSKEDFNALVDKAMQMQGRSHMRPVIEKELLHYDILFALDKEKLLDILTFQGGTLLRLCYGSQRFSEDLDFAGGKKFNKTDLISLKECIEKYVGERYGFEVTVKEPKDLAVEKINENITVDKWQVSVITSPSIRNMPKQKIKIEVINVPAYTSTPRTLIRNYDFLPDGYSDIFIPCESLDEIYADKIISLVNAEKYIRHRDIWDLRWLKQQGALVNIDLIKRKVLDYEIEGFKEKINNMLNKISDIVHGEDFRSQMSRFTPLDAQEKTLLNPKFYDYLTAELSNQLAEVKNLFYGKD